MKLNKENNIYYKTDRKKINNAGGYLIPILNWIGKEKIINHHLDVPYKIMDCKHSFDENGQHEEYNGNGNKIIYGDY